MQSMLRNLYVVALPDFDITSSDPLHECGWRIVEHDMKMLDGMNRFQGCPILKPYHLVCTP